ncbi:MAG: hypothetical protein RL748_4519 [Pseudomonadota bacterium]|jgi:lipoyl(octanoyl) transferase
MSTDQSHPANQAVNHATAPSRQRPPPLVRHLGQQDYASCYQQMRAFTDARTADTPDELWIVEHAPVFTLGLAADRSHLLALDAIEARHIAVIQTDRGGEVTYHGPGQVVIYLLLDLRRYKPNGKLFIRELVTRIEQAIIDVLANHGIAGVRKEGAPGIYLAAGRWQGAKIAALGLKVRGSGCTYHGLSLNVAMDLSPFSLINPCGYAGLATVDMQTVGVTADLAQVQTALAARLTELLK